MSARPFVPHPSAYDGTPAEWEAAWEREDIQAQHEATGEPLTRTAPCGCAWRLTGEGTYRPKLACPTHEGGGSMALPDGLLGGEGVSW